MGEVKAAVLKHENIDKEGFYTSDTACDDVSNLHHQQSVIKYTI